MRARRERKYLQSHIRSFGDVDEVPELGLHRLPAADRPPDRGLVDDGQES